MPTGNQLPVKGSLVGGDYFIVHANGALYQVPQEVVGSGGGGGPTTWGSITGTLSLQTDLQTVLNGKAALSHTHVAANITDFSEAVDDRVSALLVAGTNITLTYNDLSNTLTIASTGGGGGGNSYFPSGF